ncbi:MAG: type II CAAX endopeptidase family protein, partial [Bacteroidota bacterium]
STQTLLMNYLQAVFVNTHSELRSGWRIVLFLLIMVGVIAVLFSVLAALGIAGMFLGRVLVLVGILAATYVMTRFVNKKPFGAVGLFLQERTIKEIGIGFLLGFLMVAGIFLVEYGLGYVEIARRELVLGDAVLAVGSSLALFAVVAFAEEALFRGYIFQTTIQAITFLPAMILFSTLFALAHWGNPNVSAGGIVNIAVAGVWLSFAYMKTRSLWLPFGLHWGWNFSMTTVFSFPTSGLTHPDQQLFLLEQSGPEWVTGGAFGPEAGVLATIALVLCTWHILKSKLYATPEGIITLDSLEDLATEEHRPPEGGE